MQGQMLVLEVRRRSARLRLDSTSPRHTGQVRSRSSQYDRQPSQNTCRQGRITGVSISSAQGASEAWTQGHQARAETPLL